MPPVWESWKYCKSHKNWKSRPVSHINIAPGTLIKKSKILLMSQKTENLDRALAILERVSCHKSIFEARKPVISVTILERFVPEVHVRISALELRIVRNSLKNSQRSDWLSSREHGLGPNLNYQNYQNLATLHQQNRLAHLTKEIAFENHVHAQDFWRALSASSHKQFSKKTWIGTR